MVNKKFWLGILTIVLVLGMTVVGCDNGSTSNNGGGAPEWAYGPWYNTSNGAYRVKVAEISSTELILYKLDGSVELTAKFRDYSTSIAYSDEEIKLGIIETIRFEFGREVERMYDDTVYLWIVNYSSDGGSRKVGSPIVR